MRPKALVNKEKEHTRCTICYNHKKDSKQKDLTYNHTWLKMESSTLYVKIGLICGWILIENGDHNNSKIFSIQYLKSYYTNQIQITQFPLKASSAIKPELNTSITQLNKNYTSSPRMKEPS